MASYKNTECNNNYVAPANDQIVIKELPSMDDVVDRIRENIIVNNAKREEMQNPTRVIKNAESFIKVVLYNLDKTNTLEPISTAFEAKEIENARNILNNVDGNDNKERVDNAIFMLVVAAQKGESPINLAISDKYGIFYSYLRYVFLYNPVRNETKVVAISKGNIVSINLNKNGSLMISATIAGLKLTYKLPMEHIDKFL